VIYPPVDVSAFTPAGERGDYYVTASRMVPYKCIDAIVEAFRELPDRRLVVIGDGPQMPLVRAKAGPNVTLLGHQPHAELLRWLRGARAYLFAAVEDFGIAPLEAQAVGTPVIAYAGGALPETIPGLDAPEPCGVLYDEQTPAGIRAGVRAFEAAADRISSEACRRNALRFAPDRFRREFADFVAREWAAFGARRAGPLTPGQRDAGSRPAAEPVGAGW
jgi:glycosyltransferase involved in cell wall biosynthesis